MAHSKPNEHLTAANHHDNHTNNVEPKQNQPYHFIQATNHGNIRTSANLVQVNITLQSVQPREAAWHLCSRPWLTQIHPGHNSFHNKH